MKIRKTLFCCCSTILGVCVCGCSAQSPDVEITQNRLDDLANSSAVTTPTEVDLPIEIEYKGVDGHFPGYDPETGEWTSIDENISAFPNADEYNSSYENNNSTPGWSPDDIDTESVNAFTQMFQGLTQGLLGDIVAPQQPSEQTEETEFVVTETEAETTSLQGAKFVGVFSIPRLEISTNCYASTSQELTDEENAAAYFYTQNHNIIADRVEQEFRTLKNCVVGDIAYFVNDEKYVCVSVMDGHNTGTKLITEDGIDISLLCPGALVCYTSKDSWENVKICFFEPTE